MLLNKTDGFGSSYLIFAFLYQGQPEQKEEEVFAFLKSFVFSSSRNVFLLYTRFFLRWLVALILCVHSQQDLLPPSVCLSCGSRDAKPKREKSNVSSSEIFPIFGRAPTSWKLHFMFNNFIIIYLLHKQVGTSSSFQKETTARTVAANTTTKRRRRKETFSTPLYVSCGA